MKSDIEIAQRRSSFPPGRSRSSASTASQDIDPRPLQGQDHWDVLDKLKTAGGQTGSLHRIHAHPSR